MKYIIGLLLFSGVVIMGSAYAADADVGKIIKSDIACYDCDTVATFPAEFKPAYAGPVTPERLPICKGLKAKPAKTVVAYRRARDGL